ncbi:MAG: demethoxyubiquinone hydroxylase family protein [Pseudomonadota bacterium]
MSIATVVFEAPPGGIDANIIADLRTDHAGETGAVWIYRGVLTFARNKALIEFARHHLETEQSHLDLINEILPRNERSVLTPMWRVAGWITGAAPALFGPRAVYATIEAVETFVDRHYEEQIQKLIGRADYRSLLEVLRRCQADEVAHRDEAREKQDRPAGPLLSLWTKIVAFGSESAVSLARRI